LRHRPVTSIRYSRPALVIEPYRDWAAPEILAVARSRSETSSCPGVRPAGRRRFTADTGGCTGWTCPAHGPSRSDQPGGPTVSDAGDSGWPEGRSSRSSVRGARSRRPFARRRTFATAEHRPPSWSRLGWATGTKSRATALASGQARIRCFGLCASHSFDQHADAAGRRGSTTGRGSAGTGMERSSAIWSGVASLTCCLIARAATVEALAFRHGPEIRVVSARGSWRVDTARQSASSFARGETGRGSLASDGGTRAAHFSTPWRKSMRSIRGRRWVAGRNQPDTC